MKKALIILLLLTLIISGGLFANGKKESAPAAAPETVAEAQPVAIEIYYPVAVDAPIAKILAGYIADFQKENPNITVKPVFSGGYGDVKTAVQTTFEGGGKAPAMAVMLATDLYDLINAGYILPLDNLLVKVPDKAGYLNDIFPSFLENSKYNGKLWSIPFQRSAVVMYYNKDLFKEAGLDAPDSWDSLAAAAQKLTIPGKRWGIEWPSGWPYWLFQPLAIGAGQNIVGDSDTEVIFDNPKVIDAVNFYISLSKKYKATPAGVQGSWGAVPTNFANGSTAMIVHSTGSLTGIIKQAGFDVGVMPIPGKKKGTYASVPGGGNFYLLKGASDAEQEAAIKFAYFVTQPKYAADFSTKTGYIAVRKSAYNEPVMKDYLAKVPQAADTRDALKYAGKELSLQDLGEVRNIFHKNLQAAYSGTVTAAEAMAKAQQEADAALKDFK